MFAKILTGLDYTDTELANIIQIIDDNSDEETLLTMSDLAGILDGAPDALNTLNELAAALNDDPNFANTITNQLAQKANISDIFSGDYNDLTNKPDSNGLTLLEVNTAIEAYLLANPVGGNGVFPIWAEENSTLQSGAVEWAFGNGANTPEDQGVVVAFDCELFAGGLSLRSGSATVGIYKNGTKVADIVSTGKNTAFTLPVPIQFQSGDVIGFRTTLAVGTSSPNQITAWMRTR